MNTSPIGEAHSTAPDDLAALATSWRRSLAARRISSATIDTHRTAVALSGSPTTPAPLPGSRGLRRGP
jgi:hypothetical protein